MSDGPETEAGGGPPVEVDGWNPAAQGSSSSKENDSAVTELWPPYCNPHYVMPEEIEVRVTVPSGEYYFPVSVVKCSGRKAYIGGYRDKRNGKVFHHAFTQTPTERKTEVKDTSNLRSRETQTCEYRTLSLQPTRESGTQMERIDLSVDTKVSTQISRHHSCFHFCCSSTNSVTSACMQDRISQLQAFWN